MKLLLATKIRSLWELLKSGMFPLSIWELFRPAIWPRNLCARSMSFGLFCAARPHIYFYILSDVSLTVEIGLNSRTVIVIAGHVWVSPWFVNGTLISLSLAETTSQEVFFHRFWPFFHCVNCNSWNEVRNPSAIECQSSNILNWTRCSTNFMEICYFRSPNCSRGLKIWCRNYVSRTRLRAKSLSSLEKMKCCAGENERLFHEI